MPVSPGRTDDSHVHMVPSASVSNAAANAGSTSRQSTGAAPILPRCAVRGCTTGPAGSTDTRRGATAVTVTKSCASQLPNAMNEVTRSRNCGWSRDRPESMPNKPDLPSERTVKAALQPADSLAPLVPYSRYEGQQPPAVRRLDLAVASDRHGASHRETRSLIHPGLASPIPGWRPGKPASVSRRRTLAGLFAGTALAGISRPLLAREVEYRSFDGPAFPLYAHIGRRVALLVPRASWDPRTLARWVGALDRAWDAYRLLTATQPRMKTGYAVDDRATFAVVPGCPASTILSCQRQLS